jgi:hypothetical protein
MPTHSVQYSIQDLRRFYYLSSISRTASESRVHLSQILDSLIGNSKSNDIFKEIVDFASNNTSSLNRSVDSISYSLAFVIVKSRSDHKTVNNGELVSIDARKIPGLEWSPFDCSLQHTQGHKRHADTLVFVRALSQEPVGGGNEPWRSFGQRLGQGPTKSRYTLV